MGDTKRMPGRIGGVGRPERSRLVSVSAPVPTAWTPSPAGTGWAMLACPHCRDVSPLGRLGVRPGCLRGHTFDLARQGYVSLLSGRGRHGLVADDARMVTARSEIQGAGLYAPIRDGIVSAVQAAAREGLPGGGLLDIGGGTGYYAAAALASDAAPPYGVSFDLSSYAARRAAKAHARLVSVVADVWQRFPVLDGAASVALVAFAPRNAPELARVLAPGGVAVVVTPLPSHLSELSGNMIGIDPRKQERLDRQFEGFELLTEQEVVAQVAVTARQAAAIVGMGPSAHHPPERPDESGGRGASPSVGPGVDAIADEPGADLAGTWAEEKRDVTLAVRVATYRPRHGQLT